MIFPAGTKKLLAVSIYLLGKKKKANMEEGAPCKRNKTVLQIFKLLLR